MATPLIPPAPTVQPDHSKKADWLPTTEALAETARKSDDEDWGFWQAYVPQAVEFARAAISPDMTDERKQAILKATLATITEWHRSA